MKINGTAAFLAFVWACLVVPKATPADTIYHNGSILTMAGDQPNYAEALVVEDGKIVFVGDRDAALAMKSDRTRIIDLKGKTLLPGFLDGHSHYINSLLVANQCKLYAPPSGPGADVPSIVAELQRYARQRGIAQGELIMGYGYDDSVMPIDPSTGERRLLNRDDLDEAFPDNPVRIDHVSMHGAVLNSLALEKYGITAETETPPGGVIVRKPGTREPWGLIMETAFLPVFEQTEPMTAQQELDYTRAGQMLYAGAGITTAHDGATHYPQFRTMLRASEAGVNLIDVIAYPFVTDVDKVLGDLPVDRWSKYENRFKVGGVKITLDGSPQGRTAFFTTPYLQGGPGGEQDWRGEPTFPQELAKQMVKKVYDLQVPLIIHCNGDAAIDLFLEAYEFARAGDYSRDWNVTTIHTQFMRSDHIPRFVQYKVRPSFYTLHTFYFAEAHLANRGEAQANYISPMRDAIDAGLRPSNHTDFVVAPLDQMMMLWTAVNRQSRGGAEVGPDQRVTAYEGLKSMTAWAAEQYDELETKGTLEVGKLADLVILERNPLQVPPMEIRDIKVVETIKEGVTIFPPPETGHPLPAKPAKEIAGEFAWRPHICDMAAVNSAADTTWVLTELKGESIESEAPPTIRFSSGRVSIFGGVNQLNGSYALVRDAVVMGELVSTRKAGPAELMDLEQRFARALAAVNGFHVHGERLQLLSGDEVVATFQSVR
ncbi:MAG: amidohydrolase family protein [bacterium]|nr:amidohydrolase family protein [bacterium]